MELLGSVGSHYLGSESHRPTMKPRKLNFDNPEVYKMPTRLRSDATYYSDRFIPVRSPQLSFDFEVGRGDENMYSMVLRNELVGNDQSPASLTALSPGGSPTSRNLFHYSSSPTNLSGAQFSLSPMSKSSQKLLECPRKPPRSIPKAPIKCLEAPSIQDDFYLNLVDWSSQNIVAVALSSSAASLSLIPFSVYLWNASTASVNRLCELGDGEQVTSVSWAERGAHLAVGSSSGTVQIWDVTRSRVVRELAGHRLRVCAVSWNRELLASGSRDRTIMYRDARVAEPISRFVGHKQEVCGLRWSPDGRYLASGGNDNRLLVWDPVQNAQPLHKLTEHTAAVKAIAWSPHQRSLLASGGGTVDRTIRVWNISAGTPTRSHMSIDTGSQVCNLAWSKNVNELVSTHGYSQNQVVVWSYPSLTPVATLTGHTMRVLFLAVSPDGQMIVTGAGDETLRLWNVFPGSAPKGVSGVEHVSSLAPMEIR